MAVLAAARRTASDVETRAAAVFALHRIGTPAAREAVRAALEDRDPVVRVAAARSVGLARDAAALPALLRAVVTDAPAVRRQAATALEQIGKVEAVPTLLKASQGPADRFVEHAVIHALIALRERGHCHRAGIGVVPASAARRSSRSTRCQGIAVEPFI